MALKSDLSPNSASFGRESTRSHLEAHFELTYEKEVDTTESRSGPAGSCGSSMAIESVFERQMMDERWGNSGALTHTPGEILKTLAGGVTDT